MIANPFGKTHRALISVTNKSGIEKFEALTKIGWEIYSTGGTAKYLETFGVPVVLVEDYTAFPEMMDGRLKTLHPHVHGGLLGDTSKMKHVASMVEHGIVPIDLLVVNLYEFEDNPCIETIDIGGPAMIRAAAKNYHRVTVVTNPLDYEGVIDEILSDGNTTLQRRRMLAAKAFHYVSHYDSNIGSWLDDCVDEGSIQLQQA